MDGEGNRSDDDGEPGGQGGVEVIMIDGDATEAWTRGREEAILSVLLYSRVSFNLRPT